MPTDKIIENKDTKSETSPKIGNLGFFDDVNMSSEAY